MSQQYGQPSPQRPNNTMAIISLISSILGLTLLPTIGSVIGLITGYMARGQIRESGGREGGEGLAKAGIILGWIGVGLAVLGICLVILIWAGVLGTGIGLGFCSELTPR